MSRIGKNPISIPGGVKVAVNGQSVHVEGPKGKLSKTFDDSISIEVAENQINVSPKTQGRHDRAMWGTARSIIASMVEGVEKPFNKKLEIHGVGFKAQLNGKVLNLALGYSHPINYPLPDGVTVELDKTGTKLDVTGCDKHMVGQVAAHIKSYYPVEPYKGKGVRIVGQFVLRKEGKKSG